MRVLLYAGCATLISALASCRGTKASAHEFEIADVHSSPKTMTPRMSGGMLRGAGFEMRQATMLDLVRVAYDLTPDKVLGGPSWLELDRFDVLAKAPAGTTPDDSKLMLQALLADRFKLVAHPESKPMPAFVLTLGKGKPKLKTADPSGEPGCRPQPQTAPLQPAVPVYIIYVCRNVTMQRFVEQVHSYANGYLTAPTFDQTGLQGDWDFELKWSSRGALAAAGPDGISLFDAVDKQLGMKLEGHPVPQPVVQVVSVNRTPTANPPGITTKLPLPPPIEFEVAHIKPSAPGSQGGIRIMGSGRLDGTGVPLKNYITLAWSISNDELMAGLPKFAETTRFDIVAKAATTTGEPANLPQLDVESIRLMLQKLLKDRFKMAVHTEDRPAPGYVLTSVRPKMQTADPANRTGCTTPPPGDAKDPRLANPVLSQYVVCHNMTMAQFADQLPLFGGGYIQVPVLDSTGLTGAYDFTLSFSAFALFRNGGNLPRPLQAALTPGAAGEPGATEPNGALSLPEAVSKQLGLQMEMQKRPVPVLVIDHLEEKPVEN